MDLSTTWLGLRLPHPFVAGASPLCDDLDRVRRFEDAGIAAFVLRSLFEEQIRDEAAAHQDAAFLHADSHGEASSYLPDADPASFGPEHYVRHLAAVRKVAKVPVIASLNGCTEGGWVQYARRMADAGADAIELNLFTVPTDPRMGGAELEAAALAIAREVVAAVRVPVSVKLSPFWTSLPHLAQRMHANGVRGLVLFNRFFEPDVDPDALEVRTHMEWSTSHELLLRLRWLAILSGTVPVDLAVSGGVHRPIDAVKALLCGACAVQLVASLLRGGPHALSVLRDGLSEWLAQHDYASLEQMRGSMDLRRCPDPGAYARANYLHLLQTYRLA